MARHRRLWIVGILFLVALGALFAARRPRPPVVVVPPTAGPVPTGAPGPTAGPIATPTTPPPATPLSTRPRLPYTPVPVDDLPVAVVERSPARGEVAAPDAPVKLVFDRPMDQAAVAGAFSISPQVKGRFEWSDARTVSFRPDAPWARNAVFDVALRQETKARDGAGLGGPYQFRFATAGYLEIGQVIPAPGSSGAQAATPITVIFNRPVVPLQSVEQQKGLPQPLKLTAGGAPVAGRGEWLDTSVYLFRPDQALLGGATYTGAVDSALRDVDGNPMRTAYTWQFGVAAPQVLSTFPERDAQFAGVRPTLQVQFNQPVTQAGAQAAFRLLDGGAAVPGKLTVQGPALFFTPTQQLRFDARYTAEIAAGVAGAGAAGLAQPFSWSFRTVQLPKVTGTTPAGGERQAPPYAPFVLKFNAPIDPATVPGNLQITPAVSATAVYTSYNDYDHSFAFYFGARPSTDYTVRIGPSIADPYGNRTGQTLEVRFRTAALPADVRLLAGEIGTFNALAPARVVLSSVNAASAKLTLYRLAPEDLMRAPYDWFQSPPPAQNRLRQWSVSLQRPLDQTIATPVDLVEGGGKLAPGVYLLTLDEGKDDPYGRFQVMVVSELNLTLKTGSREALVWANRLSDGAPVAGVPLTFYTGERVKLGTATTDQDGVARLQFEQQAPSGRFVLAARPFAAAGDGWNNGISPYNFGVNQTYGGPERAVVVYTDRAIYRPGQSVRFKGVVRADRDVHFSLPREADVRVVVQAPNGDKLFEQTLRLSPLGTFDGEIKLPAGAALGQYQIAVDPESQWPASFPFSVAAYRAPEFEVAVTPEGGPNGIVGGTASRANVEARYFFGGPVPNAPVRWNVLAERYRFAPAGFERYTFTSEPNPWICIECWWQPQPSPTPILTGTTTTGAQGKFAIPLPADLRWGDGKPITSSVRLTVEASATGSDNQVIAGRGELVAHEANVYVGLAAQSPVAAAGQEVAVDLVTTGIDGGRRAGQAVEVSWERYEWTNRWLPSATGGRWESQEQRTPAGRQTATTDGRGEAVARFTPDRGGSYRAIARTSDGARTAEASVFIWVAGSDALWPRSNNDRINLIGDKMRYVPGETASILIPSPFAGPTWALVTVERGGILRYEVIRLTSNSTVYRLPITAEHAPNIYVGVMLFTGPDAARPLPDYKVGLLPLRVDPVPQTLRVTLTPDGGKSAAPGDKLSYTVDVKDANGSPVAAELSLDLVDKAVLSLLPREADVLRSTLYRPRELGISTGTGLSISTDRLLAELQKRLEQMRKQPVTYGPIAGAAAGGATTSAVVGATAAAAEAAADASGANETRLGDAARQGLTLRSNFADTAFWQAAFATDAGGKGRVEIKLPDNLTTWVLRGAGLTADTKVGEGTVEVVATKPLLVRPVAPRFLVAGDQLELAANVSNTTDRPLQVDVALSATGVSVTTPLTRGVTLAPRAEQKVTWQAQATDAPRADLVFTAAGGGFGDAARPRLGTGPGGALPIYRYAAPETVGTGGALTQAGERSELIALPPSLDTRRGELTVRLDPSLAAGMRDALRALEADPDEGTEQTVSRFLPNVVTYQALKELGIANSDLEQRLPGLVRAALDRLKQRQHADGGWGWWDEKETNPQITAYAVLGLVRARDAGFAVDGVVLDRGLGYLRGALERVDVQTTADTADRQAFFVYVLGESGQDRGKYTAERAALVQYRGKLSVYARALLALAVARERADDPAIPTLLNDLRAAAILSATGAHWEEASYDPWAMNTGARSTAIVLQALARLDPNNQLNPNVVRWLMVARKAGVWETTQESAWAIMGLAAWMRQTGELKGDYDFRLALNGAALQSGRVTPAKIGEPVTLPIAVAQLLRDQGNRLTVARGAGPGLLYYTAHLQAFLPAGEIKALDRGIVVRRRYTLASCTDGPKCPEARAARVGDVLRANLTIVAPNDLYYLRVDDPLPAGMEAVDTGLRTTSLLAEGPQLQRQPEGDAASSPWYRWWSWYSRSELRDEKVVLFADQLGKGAYEYSYTLRATQPGTFQVIPTTANEVYFPEVYGRGDGATLVVR